jgi:hypothetical protein
MKVCWFSTGISSFMAAYLTPDLDEIIYTHVPDQHPDSIRFLHDCEKLLGKKITILQNTEYRDVNDLIIKRRCVNTPFGAPCTMILKKQVRKQWESEHPGHHTYVWGFDANEGSRAARLEQTMSAYDLGYTNNNCIGCVKGGMYYWNKIRKDFPEVFEKRAKIEREIGHSCIKGVYLDELDPSRGRKQDEISEDCGIACELKWDDIRRYYHA